MPSPHQAGPAPRWLTLVPLAVLALAALPLWGISRDFHDGVIGEWGYTTGHMKGVKFWLLTSNWWGHYALYQSVIALANGLGLPAWVLIKAWMTLAIGGLGYETWRLARNYGFDQRASILASALAMAFPALCALYSSSVMHFGFAWLGLLAHRWLFWGRGWRWPAGLLLTVISYQLNSNLSLLIILGAVAWWLQPARRPTAALVATLVSGLSFFLATSVFFPPAGEYAGYNKVLWPVNSANILKIVASAGLFLTWVPLLLAPMVATFASRAWLRRRSKATDRLQPPSRHDQQLAAIGLLLTVAAALPYIMVGKGAPLFLIGPPRGGSLMWQMYTSTGGNFHLPLDAFMIRQGMVMAAPFALLTVALIKLVAGRTPVHAARIFLAGAAVALIGQITLLTGGHAAKWEQARWDQSIVNALRSMHQPPPGTVEIVLSPNRAYPYPVPESNHLLWRAFGSAQWFGIAYYRDDSHWENQVRQMKAGYAAKIGGASDAA